MTATQGPRDEKPTYGRSAETGLILIVAGHANNPELTDRSIVGGWPMINHGQGWQTDKTTPSRAPYAPHPRLPADDEITRRILRRTLDDARAHLDGADAAAAAYPEEKSLQFVHRAGRIEEALRLLINRIEPYAAAPDHPTPHAD